VAGGVGDGERDPLAGADGERRGGRAVPLLEGDRRGEPQPDRSRFGDESVLDAAQVRGGEPVLEARAELAAERDATASPLHGAEQDVGRAPTELVPACTGFHGERVSHHGFAAGRGDRGLDDEAVGA
jgi:hypothetical protein